MALLHSLLALSGLASAAAVAHPPASYPDASSSNVPSPRSLNAGLTIITHNDLTGNSSTRLESVIVLHAQFTEQEASSACSKLGEQLYHPEGNDDFLEYLSFEGEPGPYWIFGRQGPRCKSMHTDGNQGTLKCSTRLSALCTNSAPLSSVTSSDNSTDYRTSVTNSGQTFTGYRDKDSFRFLGIRYATQPERFTYSSLYSKPGKYNALDFGPQCIQGAPGIGSEDCLFLNVWSPSLPSSSAAQSIELRPILFWIHGGGFTSGTGSDPTFDGSSLASRGDVVVVTINYRLGNFGFLALPDNSTSGNFGLADQVIALEWLHVYARAFGGDPDRITIVGQSAGAASVRALLASPRAIGKFAAAIPQSNLAGQAYAMPYSEYYNISTEYEKAAVPLLEAAGCLNATSQVACLRGIDAATLSNTTTAAFLVQDGTYLVTPELEVTGNGPAANVPVLMGFMRDDGAAFISYPNPNDTIPELVNGGGFDFPSSDAASTLATLFPTPDSTNKTLNIFNTTALVSTDAQFRCLDLATAYSASLHKVFPETYFYEFNRSYQLSTYSPNSPVCEAPPTSAHPYGDPSAEYFKCHSGELYYVFGTLAFNGLPPRDDNDLPFERFVLDTWASFVRTYNPTPDQGFLRARGFDSTARLIRESPNAWNPVQTSRSGGEMLRLLQVPAQSIPFYAEASRAQCDALGLPLDYYESLQV